MILSFLVTRLMHGILTLWRKVLLLSVLGANSLGQAPDPAPTKLKNWQPFIALHSKICEICETIFRLRNLPAIEVQTIDILKQRTGL